MMHQFMELNDGTQIVHSDIMTDDKGAELVKVYVEKLAVWEMCFT